METPFVHAAGLLRTIGLFLSGVCHQLPEHTVSVAGVQMPLCARCTGTYWGAILALLSYRLRGRSRAGQLPPAPVLVLLALFVIFWGVDGANSYYQFLTGRCLLYAPNNPLRLASGLLNGLALSAVVFPLYNSALWKTSARQRPISGLRELDVTITGIVLLTVGLHSDWTLLASVVPLVDALSVLLLLGMVNCVIVVLVLGWEKRAEHWPEAVVPFALGLVLAVAEALAIAWVRALIWRAVL